MQRGRNMLQGVAQAEKEAGGDIPADAKQTPGKCFVGGLSWDTTPEDLSEYFSQFGKCECTTMRDKFSGHSRGFGFVTFENPEVAENCVQNRHVIHGRIVEAKLAVPRQLATGDKPKCKKVFVGGILSSVTEAEMRSHFEQHGEVQEAQLMCEAATGRSRGFGFVTFADDKVAETVLAGEHYLGGKRVEVKYAVPKSSMASRRNMTTAVIGGEGMMPGAFLPYMGDFPLGFGGQLYGQQLGAPMGFPNLVGMQIGMPNGSIMEFDANGVLVPSPPSYPGNTTDFPTPQQHQQQQAMQQQLQQQQQQQYEDQHHHLQQMHDASSTSSSGQQQQNQGQGQQGQQSQGSIGGKPGVPPLMIVMPNSGGLPGSTLPSPNVYDPSLMYGGMPFMQFGQMAHMGYGGMPYSPDLSAVMASMQHLQM